MILANLRNDSLWWDQNGDTQNKVSVEVQDFVGDFDVI